MSRQGKKYSDAYREEILRQLRSGKSVRALAETYEPTEQTIYKWMRASGMMSVPVADETESQELKRLRREVLILREEKEILKKAAAWFAGESSDMLKKRSDS